MGSVVLDVIFVIVGLSIILVSAKQGLIKNVFHSAKLILAFVITYFLGGKLAALLYNTWVSTAVYNFMHAKFAALYQGSTQAIDSQSVLAELPAFLRTSEMAEQLNALEGGSGDAIVGTVAETVSAPIATLISNVLGYVLVFVLALVLLWLGVKVLDGIIEKIKLLNRLNTVLGAVWGFLMAVLVLFVAASVLKVFLSQSVVYTDSSVVKFFGDSAWLQALKIFNVGEMLFSNLAG